MTLSKVLAKYVFLRWKRQYAWIGEHGIVWLMDADKTLSRLTDFERQLLLYRELRFTIPEIAKQLHCGHATVERRLPKTRRKAEALFGERRPS